MNHNEFSSEWKLPAPLLLEARFENHGLSDVAAETVVQLDAIFGSVELRNRRVAVAAGSRGIDQIAKVIITAVTYLKSRGARPFVFPAMGSHGGSTAEGQADVLATFGITEKTLGAPINASMETTQLGQTPHGIRVFASRPACEADAILLINRIKPHTDFISPDFGSGLQKMIVIGLGKADGAFEFHRAVSRYGYELAIKEISSLVLRSMRNIYGLALLEDSYHHLAKIEAAPASMIPARERVLIAQAKAWMPSLPFADIDVLIVDQLGKNISGAGMDPNIIGRDTEGLAREGCKATVKTIYVRGLTPETHGNAIGIGMADVTSSQLVGEIDTVSTYTNALSSLAPAAVRIPMHFPSDHECLRAAIRMSGVTPDEVRIVHVKNTLALDRVVASSNYLPEVAKRDDLCVISELGAWDFSPDRWK